jgi:hypothetical protein
MKCSSFENGAIFPIAHLPLYTGEKKPAYSQAQQTTPCIKYSKNERK